MGPLESKHEEIIKAYVLSNYLNVGWKKMLEMGSWGQIHTLKNLLQLRVLWGGRYNKMWIQFCLLFKPNTSYTHECINSNTNIVCVLHLISFYYIFPFGSYIKMTIYNC
jgi:hypothetical protein